QLESRVADELGDRLPTVHESIEDADVVSASQQQVDRVPADVAGPAEHQDRSVPVCDQRRDEGRMPAEGQGDEQPAEDHGGRDDESPEDHAGCRRAEQHAADRRRPHDRYRISCSSPAGTTPTVHGHGAPRQATLESIRRSPVALRPAAGWLASATDGLMSEPVLYTGDVAVDDRGELMFVNEFD